MKYKKGDKFIVEIESTDATGILRIKGGGWTAEETFDDLEPYDESAAYQRGLNDAWEAARKIANSPGKGGFPELYSIFGLYSSSAVLNGLKASEAIAKIRAYEDAQVIRVGDEVTCEGYGGKAVVTYEYDEDATILHWLGGASHVEKDHLTKTGRHFPEVAALLEKMKGDADESD